MKIEFNRKNSNKRKVEDLRPGEVFLIDPDATSSFCMRLYGFEESSTGIRAAKFCYLSSGTSSTVAPGHEVEVFPEAKLFLEG
jgi:hypothetical protein